MKQMRILSLSALAMTFGVATACGSSAEPSGDGDGDSTTAPGDGDGDGSTVGDGDGDGDAPATGGDTSTGGGTATGGGTSTGGTVGTGGGTVGTGGGTTQVTGNACDVPAALNDYYQPTGWMGDNATITIDGENDPCEERSSPGAMGDCYKITVGEGSVGSVGWTGIFWQNPGNNWGEGAACDFSDSPPTITFMAKGAEGGEEVSFFGSDIPEGTLGVTALTDEWTEYTIDLSLSTNTSNIWGAFGWSSAVDIGTFYIDDIRISGDGGGMGGAAN